MHRVNIYHKEYMTPGVILLIITGATVQRETPYFLDTWNIPYVYRYRHIPRFFFEYLAKF